MKTTVSILTILLCMASSSYAQLIAKDSTGVMAISLDEITIQAQSVIEKGDRKVILPTQNQLKMSSSGIDLLGKLQLPRITVDIMSGEITTSGNGEVQLRINGVQVTYTEISSLNPENILRIEYHDTPGVRYGNAAAVIDYITKTAKVGGSISGAAIHSISGKRSSIDDVLAGRYNYGKSEISANVRYIQRRGDWTREYDERFIFPDKELHRLEVGEPTLFNKKLLTSNLSYSLQEKGKYLFNAQCRYILQDNPAGYEDRKSKLYISDSDIPLSIYDHTKERNHLPALDFYYQQELKNDQRLIFNFVGTYIKSSSTRIYQEKQENVSYTELDSDITGQKYSLIAEGTYEKKLGQGTLIGGLRHIQSYTDNQYKGEEWMDVVLKQAESYAYAEYKGKTQHWGYVANLALSRFYYSQRNNQNERYGLQPSLLVSYTPLDKLHFRYHINLKNNAPSIAYLNNVEQKIDNLQTRRGNPSLKSFRSTIQDFNAVFSAGICSIDALISYTYEKNPIMQSVLYEEAMFIQTYENQKSFQYLAAEVTFKIKPWKDHISLSVTPGINRYISTGNNYLHTYTLKELRINLDASYKNWLLNFMTITPPNRYVYGEQLMKGELMHTLMVGYKQPAWSIMAGILNPFMKTYRSENENWSALTPVKSDIHNNNMSNTFAVKLNFNLNFGRQYKDANKRIQNMDTDSGILQGTKE
ncbi:outer membrane beta-barrel family protein [Bacteroides timonensis]|uniref:outer membrane beta-barrel family protein n=1 Tax=Bacteroides timonensis TaxID=1470345 RepID=UPI001FCB4B29|nr:outer membrane beta-barrel family protein [Bacteroides timonensis]